MPLLSAPRLCVCGHPVYDEEPRCPLCACQEHRARLSAAVDHGAPATVSHGTGEGRRGAQPELPWAARYCFLRRYAAARNLCPRTLPASVVPAARCQRHPAVGRPGRTQPPCGRDRTRLRESTPVRVSGPAVARVCPGLPGTPLSAACCRCRRAEPERRSEAPADGSAQRICRFERRRQSAPPPGSTWPLSRALGVLSCKAVGQATSFGVRTGKGPLHHPAACLPRTSRFSGSA